MGTMLTVSSNARFEIGTFHPECSEKRSVAENCGTKYYSCDSGECIPREKACNRNYDCTDGSDEMKCEYFLAAQRAHSKSTNAANANVISKFGKNTRNQEDDLYDQKSGVRNRHIPSLSDNGDSYPSGISNKGYGNDHRHFSGYGKTGQFNNAYAWTANGRTGYNRKKADGDHNRNREKGNDKQNVYVYIPHNGGDEQRHSVDQYKELNGRISEIQQADHAAHHVEQLSSNDQEQGLNYEPNDVRSSAGSESLGSHTERLFLHGGIKDGSYHSGTVYGETEARYETNQTSYTDQDSNGIGEKDEEDIDECSDQEFRCPYLTRTLCVHYMKICDGIDDCGDGSDEINCADDETTAPTIDSESFTTAIAGCEPNQFRCENGKCIAKIDRCDRKYDCDDGTDETTCEYFVQALKQSRTTTIQPDEIPEVKSSYTESEEQKYSQIKKDEERRIQGGEQERLRKEKEQEERRGERLGEEQEREQERRQEEEKQGEGKERIRQEYYEKERQRLEIEQQKGKEDGQKEEWERQEQERKRQKMEIERRRDEEDEERVLSKERESFEEEQQLRYREDEQGREEERKEESWRRLEEDERYVEEDRERLEEDRRRLEEDRRYEEEDRRHEEEDRRHVEEDRRHVEEDRRHVEEEERRRLEEDRRYEEEDRRHVEEDRRHVEEEERRRLEGDRRYEEEDRGHVEEEDRRYEEEDRRHVEEEERRRLEEDSRRLEEDRRYGEEDRRHVEEEDRKRLEGDRRYEEEDRKHVEEPKRELEKKEKDEDGEKHEKHQMTIEGVRIRESKERRRLELENYNPSTENEIDDGGYTDANARERYEVVGAGEICALQQYQCVSGECIEMAARCDGKADCSDGSDEMLCHPEPQKQSISQTLKPITYFLLHFTTVTS
ncbi:unnamed protein product [Acanthocheilonema viteae]|uniref:Uncharacterized protein n=1 Tax=Acanthocheilonema viteae TaxID=6277 RepID=A0A498SPP3_ACAVI|nr:unnamed protein product [Acanthocheilonema viteae]